MVLGVDSRSSQLAAELIGRAHGEISARAVPNRFVDLLEAGGVPRERLTWLAGEQFRIVGSDQRSFALLAARFPDPPAGEMFLSLRSRRPTPRISPGARYSGPAAGSRWRCWPT